MKKHIGWIIMTILALGISLLVSRYFTLNPEVFFEDQRTVYIAHRTAIIMHILGGVIALTVGPFQFLHRVRSKYPQIHRWLGRLYLAGIFLGGVFGLYMATYAYAGIISSLGFASLAILWLTTGFLAYRTIRAGDVAAHRRWMIRNFALTFAAVTLRLELFFLAELFGFDTGYQMVAWLCWIPNLLVAEAIIRRTFKRRLAAQPAR